MPTRKRKVVIVDDVKFQLLSIQQRLKAHYDFFPAQNVKELFDILDKVKPEVILLDINMPDVDGFEAFEKIRELPQAKDIPIIFLTARNDQGSKIKGMRIGAADYLTKPFTDNDFIDRIEGICDPSRSTERVPIICAVDDDISILTAISSILKDKYSVCTVPEPQKLGVLLKKLTPDLFILDCLMPGMSGYDCVPVIRGFPEHEKTPIIFLTSEGKVDNVTVAINYGAADFIVKPVDEGVLKSKVELHLKNYIIRRRVYRD